MKALAAVSMWDLCTEKGSGDLDQFQKVNRLISDQLFSNFVSEAMLLYTPLGPPQRPAADGQPRGCREGNAAWERCEHSCSSPPS